MKIKIKFAIIFLPFLLTSFVQNYKWGFFGHRRINRLAVFTLSPDMMPLYKNSIEFLTEHAVDADKRRYAVKDEAPRHFIDLDRWYINGKLNLPKRYDDALITYTDLVQIKNNEIGLFGKKRDTIFNKVKYFVPEYVDKIDTSKILPWSGFRNLINSVLIPLSRKEDNVIIKGKTINDYFQKVVAVDTMEYLWIDTFSFHGVLPYQLPDRYRLLVNAFKQKDKRSILRLSADIGHYVGDAHVPLHTTSNYNGQQTNQLGLHAFWESRIPELFADTEYDYLVGKALYIKDINRYVWDIVLESHSYVDSVLLIEKRLSQIIPPDQQYCFDDRLGTTIRTQCEAYAKAYQQAMKGMVEKRMRASILAVGSLWYSAWIDAGQPNLSKLVKSNEILEDDQDLEINKAYKIGEILGRPEN